MRHPNPASNFEFRGLETARNPALGDTIKGFGIGMKTGRDSPKPVEELRKPALPLARKNSFADAEPSRDVAKEVGLTRRSYIRVESPGLSTDPKLQTMRVGSF